VQVVLSGDDILFRGRDDAGKRWQAALPVSRGIAHTAVWQADFDHNSRQDLLVAAYSFSNGRCIDEITLSFILFNNHGQPVPWVVQTRSPSSNMPAIFADLNHNGRAELVVTDCTYGDSPRFGEDRRITGVYEAKDAAWSLVKSANLAPYTSLVRQSHRFDRTDVLLPSIPVEWTDQGNRFNPSGSPSVHVVALKAPSENCRGPIHLPPVVDGRLQVEGWHDPCDVQGHNRLELSNGTVCYDWPTVILDDESGREIVAGSEHPERVLEAILDRHLPVSLAGQRDSKRCSPVVLWAFPPRLP